MRLETARMCQVAGIDATIGINAMIDALPIDAGDTRPAHVHVYNSMDDQWVARRTVSEGDSVQFPAIAIIIQPSTVHQVMTSVRDSEIPVIFAYLAKNADSAEAQRDASYTTRALLRFLRRLADPANAALRLRNGVQLINPIENVQQGEAIVPWGKAIALAATEITWLVRETAA